MGLIAEWWEAHAVPRLIRCACGAPAISGLREKVVPLAHGAVFELGCGGGLNQRFYGADVASYAGLDPSAKGLDFARGEAAAHGWPVDLREGAGEAVPFADAMFDSVVCTFTLCSVADPAQVLAELYRVLKPGGALLFAEHGLAPDAGVRRWQQRVEPVWKRLAGGCHLTRPPRALIAEAGFALGETGARYLPKTPRIAGWAEWGLAQKPG
ncbi:MAG: class I SAM-dependent methyltransferase [Proteobacteria bacterium]|nr:class I SAM-dependent methyltransferase [Pseudomonadota bacterium]